jgi:hypothetical protein
LFIRLSLVFLGGHSLWEFQIVLYYALVKSLPLSLPLNLLPTLLQAIAKGIITLFHIGIWSPSTMFLHLNLPCSPFPSHCTNFTVLSFIINFHVSVQRVLRCSATVIILYFGPLNPFCYAPSPLPPTSPPLWQLSVHDLIPSTSTVVTF